MLQFKPIVTKVEGSAVLLDGKELGTVTPHTTGFHCILRSPEYKPLGIIQGFGSTPTGAVKDALRSGGADATGTLNAIASLAIRLNMDVELEIVSAAQESV